jgi:ABC-type transport system involved in multi-copper enzyme maturation permease subunit
MTAVAHPAVTAPREHVQRITQTRVIRSEWTKLRSLRSTVWSLASAIVTTIGLPVLFAAVVASHWSTMRPAERAHRHPLDIALAGVNISQLALGVLGVLMITGEYSTGMIRASFTAVPRRLPVLWGKVVVYATVVFALLLPSVVASYLASQAVLARHHILQTSLSAPSVARAVVGGALYVTVIGLFGLALGAIVRNTAGGIAAFVAILFVIPPLMNVLPSSWNDAITPYLPSTAGRAIFSLGNDPHSLGPWTGFGLFCGYTLVALAAAAVLLVRRDT